MALESILGTWHSECSQINVERSVQRFNDLGV